MKFILGELANYHKALDIIKKQPIDHRIHLLNAFEPETLQFRNNIVIIGKLRDVIEHEDTILPKKKSLERLLSELKLFIEFYQKYIKMQHSVFELSTVKEIFSSEVNTLKVLMQGLEIEANIIDEKITPFVSYISNLSSYNTKDQMLKLIEIKDEQSKLVTKVISKVENDNFLSSFGDYVASGDDYYTQRAELNSMLDPIDELEDK